MSKFSAAVNEVDTILEIRSLFNRIFPNAQMIKGVFGTNVKHGDANDLRGTQTVFMDEPNGDLNLPAGFIGFVQNYHSFIQGNDRLAQIIIGEGIAGTQSRTSEDAGATWSAWV